jgi:hypothetical protein
LYNLKDSTSEIDVRLPWLPDAAGNQLFLLNPPADGEEVTVRGIAA